jgi:tubulin---tyrosine ligase
VPRTWDIDISWADELDELWSDELWELGELLDSADPADPRWFILKPSMSDRGMGIRLFESKEALSDIFLSFEEIESDGSDGEIGNGEGDVSEGKDTSVIASQLRHFVIQVNALPWMP